MSVVTAGSSVSDPTSRTNQNVLSSEAVRAEEARAEEVRADGVRSEEVAGTVTGTLRL
jgi:hypothetical protein